MASHHERITDMTLTDLSDTTTPVKKEEAEPSMPFTPGTSHRVICRLQSTVHELIEFKDVEETSKTSPEPEDEQASLRQSLKDANVLLSDGGIAITSLQKENCALKEELQKCQDSMVQQQKESELKMFRLQKELEHKSTEIVSLRKDKTDFDFKTKLLESRHQRKVEELSHALAEARGLHSAQSCPDVTEPPKSDIAELSAKINELTKTQASLTRELEESKELVQNLEQIVKIQTTRGDLLSAAFEDSLQAWKEISEEVSDVLESYKTLEDFSVPTIFDDLQASPIFDELYQLKCPFLEPFTFDEFSTGVPVSSDVAADVKDATLSVTSWCRSLIDQWAAELQETKMATEAFELDARELISLCGFLAFGHDVLLVGTSHSGQGMGTSMMTTEVERAEVQTALPVDEKLLQEVTVLKEEKQSLNEKICFLAENETKLKKLTEDLTGRVSVLLAENSDLSRALKGVREALAEAEKGQAKIVETTAEVVKDLKGEFGDRVVNMAVNNIPETGDILKIEYENSGMTSYLSAIGESNNQTELGLAIETVYSLPREHSDSLDSFAKEFAEYLVTNQIFHPEDEPPSDPSVFYFVLDRYLLLVDTYHNARSEFERNLNDLEQHDALATVKAEALLTQLSQLEVSDSDTGTLCDSSFTASSADFDYIRSSTLCEPMADTTVLASGDPDVTHDPLQLTRDLIPETPVISRGPRDSTSTPARNRTSLNGSRIPLGRVATPGSVRSHGVVARTPRTPRIPEDDVELGTPSCSFMEGSCTPIRQGVITTPLQRALRREPSAKKSVTFRSPLLARTVIEAENVRLKSVLDDKLSAVAGLERSVETRLKMVQELETRVAELEVSASEARLSLERAEAEFSEKRQTLESEVEEVRAQLSELTNMLVVEAVTLDPALEDRLRLVAPCQVLKILLETIITRCQKAQEVDKNLFEKEREEWTQEMLQVAETSQSLQGEVRELTNRLAELQSTVQSRQQEQATLEDKVTGLEEDVLRLVTDNNQLERDNVQLVKEYENKLKALEASIAVKEVEVTNIEKEIDEFRGKVCVLEEKMVALAMEKKTVEDSESDEEVESLKLALENSAKENEYLKEKIESFETLKKIVENLELQKNDLQNKIESLLTEKKVVDEEIKTSTAIVDEICSKYFCEETKEPANLSSRIQVIREVATKRFEVLDEENNSLRSLVAKLHLDVTQLREENDSKLSHVQKLQAELDILTKKISDCVEDAETDLEKARNLIEEKEGKIDEMVKKSQNDEEKLKLLTDRVDEVIEEKTSLAKSHEGDLEVLKIKISELERVKIDLDCQIAEKEGLLTKLTEEKTSFEALLKSREEEVEALVFKLANFEGNDGQKEVEKVEEVVVVMKESCEVQQNCKDDLLKEQTLLIEMKEKEIEKLQREYSETVQDLLNQKEKSAAQLKQYSSDLEAEIEKQKETAVQFESLNGEVISLRESLNKVKEEAEKYRSDLERVLTEKLHLENTLLTVQDTLKTAEKRLLDAEVRNNEFESELNVLSEELSTNKNLVDRLNQQLEALASMKKELSTEKIDLVNQVNDLIQSRDACKTKKDLLSTQLEELTQSRDAFQSEKDSLTTQLEELIHSRDSFQTEKDQLTLQLQELTQSRDAFQSEKDSLTTQLQELIHSRDSFQTEIDQLTLQLQELTQSRDAFQSEKDSLTTQLQELIHSRDSFQTEKDQLTLQLQELTQSRDAFQTEKDLLTTQLEELIHSRDSFQTEKELLTTQLQELTQSRDAFQTEKDLLTTQLEELIHSKNSFQTEKDLLTSQLQELTQSRDAFRTEKDLLTTQLEEVTQSRDRLVSQLEAANVHKTELEQQVEEYKSTEAAILRKLEEKQKSDETALKLRTELAEISQKLAELTTTSEHQIKALNSEIETLKSDLKKKAELVKTAEIDLVTSNKEVRDLEEAVRNLVKDRDHLNTVLDGKEKALRELSTFVKDLENKVWQKEEETLNANNLISQRTDTISNLNTQVEKLNTNNMELYELLEEIQKTLGLPEEAVLNLSGDTNTRSYLRLFHENVAAAQQEMDGLRKQHVAMTEEQQRLTVEVEKLTSEKVHFEIKAAELDAFGRSQEEQILALSGKLSKLEAGAGRRSRRGSDPIGPRRLEKLEEMNKTLHELLTQLLNTMQMPNAAKLRLISQREVEAASRQILDHAARLAAAQASLESLQEQMKGLDQENQELSDNMEALLKDNGKLELQILELQNSSKSSATHCSTCADLRRTLKKKSDDISKMEAEIKESKARAKELDQENDDLSNNVEALLKDNSKLEMQIIELQNGTLSLKDCSVCKNLRKKMSAAEDEIAQLKTQCVKSDEHITSLEADLKLLKNKCVALEGAVSEKEQQLFRALNSRVRGDELRMGGGGGGLAKDIDQVEKIRSLSRDNNTLKELLRQRAQTIKKLEAQVKEGLDTNETPPVMHTNSINSPIRERNYNLRTRNDVAAAYKRVLRPKTDGVENIRI